MTTPFRHAAIAAVLMSLTGVPARAEVSRVEIVARRDVANGQSFGSAGPYEQISGRLYFSIDPANPRNQVIADIDKAPRNAAGFVEMSADLVILKPRDARRGNGIALFDIVNRGNGVVIGAFNAPVGSASEGDVGDGFVLNRGYTIVRVGWEFDALREGAVRIEVPAATGVTGIVSATLIPTSSSAEATFSDLAGYAPRDPGAAASRLTVRSALGAEWVLIDRSRWALKGNTVTLQGGFEPGLTYTLSYEAVNPPVAGLGFAAVRDAAAWAKDASNPIFSAGITMAYGSSQTGRWLRDFLYEGFNADERSRLAFDAVFAHIGGAGGIDLDRRWATPTSLSMETVTRFPFADRAQRDAVTGLTDGILENPRARSHMPKIFYTNSSTEYWQRGMALAHTTPDGARDIELLDNVRMYNLAGASHNIGGFPPAVVNGELPNNPYNYRPALRALLVTLEQWVRDGVAPPPSRFPRLRDRTLVRAADVAFPALSGVTPPRQAVPGARGANRLLPKEGGAGAELPYLVPQVDRDGNEVAGLRLPDISVPLGTYNGWNFRNRKAGGTDQLFALMGGYLPFARTKAERVLKSDPRLSLEERYRSREHYLTLVRTAAASLVADRYLLGEDVPSIVERSSEHWDLLMAPATTTARVGR